MIQRSFRVLIALLLVGTWAGIARADSITVSGICQGCLGPVDVYDGKAAGSVFPMVFMGGPDIPGYPELSAQFQPDVPWSLLFDTSQGFLLTDGPLTIIGRITSFDIGKGKFYNAQVNFTTATDSVEWLDPATGAKLDLPQTGAGGGGYIRNYTSWDYGSIQVGFDLPNTPVLEPGSFALLSLGLLGVCLGFAAAHGVQKR